MDEMPVGFPKRAEIPTVQSPEPQRLQGEELRRALIEFRDTPDESRAAELKRTIVYSIAGE